MKTMIFISLAALMPTTKLEFFALSRALSELGESIPWSFQDHVALSRQTTMLEAINAIATKSREDRLLITYLEHLHKLLDEYTDPPNDAVLEALNFARAKRIRCVLFSDYPLQTTNLARATALHVRATGVGDVFALHEAREAAPLGERLRSLIATEGLDAAECIAAVSHPRDAKLAKDLGLSVRRTHSDAMLMFASPWNCFADGDRLHRSNNDLQESSYRAPLITTALARPLKFPIREMVRP